MFLHQVQYASSDAAQCVILYSMTYMYFNVIQLHKKIEIWLARQNGRKMTSFRGAMAKLGAGVDNELGGSAPHQCR